jgi:hypothetical protein
MDSIIEVCVDIADGDDHYILHSMAFDVEGENLSSEEIRKVCEDALMGCCFWWVVLWMMRQGG